jgi:hypothetical protein
MMPGLGSKYEIEIETISKPKAEYHTDDYYALDLPVAPAIMVQEEIIVEGTDIEDHAVEIAICMALGLPEPEPPRKGLAERLFGKQP